MKGMKFLAKRRIEAVIFLIVFFAFFGFLGGKMGLPNMMDTIMNTAYKLLLDTVFYIMAITVISGALGNLLVEFGVVRLIEVVLRPLMKPLYNLPGVAALGGVMTFLSDNPAILALADDASFKRYFKKYNKLKNALEIVNIQKEETLSDINYIESVIYELENCLSIEDIQNVYEEIEESDIFKNSLSKKNHNKEKNKCKKSKNLTKNKFASFNPLKYTIDGYTILVGRNNKENDFLTTKFAKYNDIWFHTKDIHGSHVILKTNTNETIPEEVIYETAKLAAKHSKAKLSSNIPVDYCPITNVKKPNGSKPGMVIYKNNK